MSAPLDFRFQASIHACASAARALGELVDVFGVAETALGATLTLGADIDEEDPSEDLLVKPYKPRARSAAASVDASNVDVFFLRGAGGATLFVVIFGAEVFFEKRFDDLAGVSALIMIIMRVRAV